MSLPGLEILTDLPSTEFQCNICLYVFEKKTISEKDHKNHCKNYKKRRNVESIAENALYLNEQMNDAQQNR